MQVTILGAGAMGSALTVPLVDNDHDVTLWGSRFDEEILAEVREGNKHPRLDVALPPDVTLAGPDELRDAIAGCDTLVLGVSSQGVVPVTERIAPHVTSGVTLVTIAKGIVEFEDKPYFIAEGIETVLEENDAPVPPVVCMGGPSIASELAERSRTAVNLAAENETSLDDAVSAFETNYFGIKPTPDLKGLEVCIGYKNAYSISLAWPDGVAEREHKTSPSSMTNLKAILFLQTISELKAIAGAVGGRPDTVDGLAGLGDLVTTSSGGRNGSFGRLIGSGHTPDEAMAVLKERGVGVVEGYETADLGLARIQSLVDHDELSMEEVPLLREINRVLYEDKPVTEAIEAIRI